MRSRHDPSYLVYREMYRETEIWQTVADFPRYEASSFGRIRFRIDGGREKAGYICRLVSRKYGYFGVQVSEIGKKGNCMGAHILVCSAFHGAKPFKNAQAAHKDGCPWNNRPENLYWATSKQNNEDRIRHGTNLPGQKNPSAKLSAEQVIEIKNTEKRYGAATALASKFGVSPSAIDKILSGRTWAKGLGI